MRRNDMPNDMSVDQAGTRNVNQVQASKPIPNEIEKQIHPTVKFNPRQESQEATPKTVPKTVEDAPSVESTEGGL